MPTREQYAYLAGLIDGEGYLKPESAGQIRIGMNHEATIKWLRVTFGGTAGGPYRTPTGAVVKWEWCLAMRNHSDLLANVIPYLILKRRKAEAMLALVRHSQLRPAINQHTLDRPDVASWLREHDYLREAIRAA